MCWFNNGEYKYCRKIYSRTLYVPKVEEAKSGKPVLQQKTSSMIVETKNRVQQEGWWSYELCYQKRLRQINLENEKVVQEFVLGVYDAEATAAVLGVYAAEATAAFNQNLSDISFA